jgi:hypothetical protein
MPLRSEQRVQVFRRADGRFAYKADGAPLQAGEMLIGRDFDPGDALEVIEQFNAAALGQRKIDGRA